MVSRWHSFLAGLALSAVLGYAVISMAVAQRPQADTERHAICAPGAAKAGRPSDAEWRAMKNVALDRAGIPRWQSRDYQYDHVTPRCLGGSNHPSNLRLVPWSQARQRDHDETRICRAYCAGRLSLADARAQLR
jgi:hypothetical protein